MTEGKGRAILSGWWSWYRDSVLITAVALVFSLDQVTKALVRHNLTLNESVPPDGIFRITRTFNTGSAFGLFADQTMFLILASFVGIGILLLMYRSQRPPGIPLRLSLGMQIGGAAGNLFDRLRMGQVTDFIDVGLWPVFNLADTSIVIGIAILVSVVLFDRRGDRRPEQVLSRGRWDRGWFGRRYRHRRDIRPRRGGGSESGTSLG